MPESDHTLVVGGRRFLVVAKFSGPDRAARANAYMVEHRSVGLLADQGGVAYLALQGDKDTPVDPPAERNHAA